MRSLIVSTLALSLLLSPLGATDDGTAVVDERLLNPTQVELVTPSEFQAVLKHHLGKVVVVNLWATWCIPCIQELPDLDLLQQRYRERGLVVLAVSLDTPDNLESKVRTFFAEKAPGLVSYLADAEDSFAFVEKLDPDWIGALPTSFFIDRDGSVSESHAGRLIFKQFEQRILELLDGD